jgi:hypothetical protein
MLIKCGTFTLFNNDISFSIGEKSNEDYLPVLLMPIVKRETVNKFGNNKCP